MTDSEGPASTDEAKKVVLSHVRPPVDSLVLWVIFLGIWIYYFPSADSLDEVATVETFTHRIFPDLISVQLLAYIRLAIAAIIWVITIEMVLSPEGTPMGTGYLPGSKLHGVSVPLKGLWTLAPITAMWWTYLGVYFSLSGFIALQSLKDESEISVLVLRAGIMFWMMSAPSTIVVSAMVRYAIWEQVLRDGGDTRIGLREPRSLMQHNFNTFVMLCELALLGGVPIRLKELPGFGVVGNAYILFMWSMLHRWVDVKEHGPQVLYFFGDPTLPNGLSSIIVLALLAGAVALIKLLEWVPAFLASLPGDMFPRVLFVLGVCSVVCRFRD